MKSWFSVAMFGALLTSQLVQSDSQFIFDSTCINLVDEARSFNYADNDRSLEMFDGSRKPFAQNIDETAKIVAMAHAAGISCEGEIGFVGYANGENSAGTDPAEAAQFARETGVDAMAISVGNVHLQQDKEGGLDLERIAQIDFVHLAGLVVTIGMHFFRQGAGQLSAGGLDKLG